MDERMRRVGSPGRAYLLALGGSLIGCGGASVAPVADASASIVDTPDAEGAEGGSLDAGPLDATFADAPADAAADASIVDAAPDASSPPAPYARPTYVHLAETGLFADAASTEVARDALAFQPTYALWSDGAAKRRWVHLPAGAVIDTRDMDHWSFPVGTKTWKEFSVDGKRVETRLVERYGTGVDDVWMGAFVWNEAGTDAVFAEGGASNVLGTPHDVPAQKDCGACHRGEPGRVLGFSALQLSHATNGPTLADLAGDATRRWMTTAPDPAGYGLTGDATAVAALGYLHANCGHCHNENGTSWPDTQMLLRLTIADRDPAASGVARSIVGVPLQYWRGGAITNRVTPGDPDASAVVARMSARGSRDQMPPLATEEIDPTGLASVHSWIASLTP